MISLKTCSGSNYQIDINNKRLRRLNTFDHPANAVRVDDNEWRSFVEVGSVSGGEYVFTVGEAALFVWKDDKMTITSSVEEITEMV
jgi:hypothetical protein